MTYSYRSPTDYGYIEQKLSRSEKKELLRYLKIHTPPCLVTLAKFKEDETSHVIVEVLSSKLNIAHSCLHCVLWSKQLERNLPKDQSVNEREKAWKIHESLLP